MAATDRDQWVQLRFIGVAGPTDVLDVFGAVDAPEGRRLRKMRYSIGGLSRSKYFVCQLCGLRQLRAALLAHISHPEIGLSECKRIQLQHQRDEAKREQVQRTPISRD